MKDTSEESMLFPFYINQERLLDIYAILNGGYAEYEEVSINVIDARKKAGNIKGEAGGGFRLFKIGSTVVGSIENSNSESTILNSKKVQTPTSMLNLVVEILNEHGYIKTIKDVTVGSFVVVPATMKINSIKSLINEALELTELSGKMQELDKNKSSSNKNNKNLINNLKKISGITKELFGSEEIVCDTENYALVGTISDAHLYQAVRADIIGAELQCLAQVKGVFPNGTSLMKNTIFTKLNDKDSKADLITSLHDLINNSKYTYESEVIPEIEGKPVYQLEVIALYQLAVV